MSLFGENESIETEVSMVQPDAFHGLDLLHIRSQIKVPRYGIIKFYDINEKAIVQKAFHEYLRPVDFQAYLSLPLKVCIFRAAKDVVKAVHRHLTDETSEINLVLKDIDFSKLTPQFTKYHGAWFSNVNNRIHSEGLSGNDVQDDARFRELLQTAELSNVTIPFSHGDSVHNVMITRRGSLVLKNQYKDEADELGIVLEVKKKILDMAWK